MVLFYYVVSGWQHGWRTGKDMEGSMEPGQSYKYSDKTKAGLLPGMGKKLSSLPKHPDLLQSPSNSIFDR